MTEKLTATQVRELVSFHKKAASHKGRPKPTARIITDPKEVAKIMPGIISHYTIKVKCPPTESGSRE